MHDIKVWHYAPKVWQSFSSTTFQSAFIVFLPRDASAEHGDATVSRPSVGPSICL